MTDYVDPLMKVLTDAADTIGGALTSSNTYAAIAGSVGNMFSGIAGVADVVHNLANSMAGFASNGADQSVAVFGQTMDAPSAAIGAVVQNDIAPATFTPDSGLPKIATISQGQSVEFS